MEKTLSVCFRPVGLANIYGNRKMAQTQEGIGEWEKIDFTEVTTNECLGKVPTVHKNKCIIFTNSFGGGCPSPKDIGDNLLPNVIYCKDTNRVFYFGKITPSR